MVRSRACILALLALLNANLCASLQQEPSNPPPSRDEAPAPEPPPRSEQPAPSQPVDPAPDVPRRVVLRNGAEVKLKFAQNLSSKSAVIGDPVELMLDEDLKVEDDLVCRKGARVLGFVTLGKESEKKRASAQQLAIRVEYLKVGQARVRLRGEKGAKGETKKGMAVGMTVAFGLSGLLFALSQKKFFIPEGTPVAAFVDEDVELDVLPPVQAPPPQPVQPESEASTQQKPGP